MQDGPKGNSGQETPGRGLWERTEIPRGRFPPHLPCVNEAEMTSAQTAFHQPRRKALEGALWGCSLGKGELEELFEEEGAAGQVGGRAALAPPEVRLQGCWPPGAHGH